MEPAALTGISFHSPVYPVHSPADAGMPLLTIAWLKECEDTSAHFNQAFPQCYRICIMTVNALQSNSYNRAAFEILRDRRRSSSKLGFAFHAGWELPLETRKAPTIPGNTPTRPPKPQAKNRKRYIHTLSAKSKASVQFKLRRGGPAHLWRLLC